MRPCKRCGHSKSWSGDNPTCPFSSRDVFSTNWNCGLINEIRDICDVAANGTDYRLHYKYCDDQKYATIAIDQIGEEDDSLPYMGLTLWVTWYKSRGATDRMFILDSHDPPRPPTFDELKRIIAYYKSEKLI
jgi:hypothetical protein